MLHAGYGILPSSSDIGIKLHNANRELMSLSFENIDYSVDTSKNILTLSVQSSSSLSVTGFSLNSVDYIDIETPSNYYNSSYEEFPTKILTMSLATAGFSSSTNPYGYVNIKIHPTATGTPLELTLQYTVDGGTATELVKYPYGGVEELNIKAIVIYNTITSSFIVKAV